MDRLRQSFRHLRKNSSQAFTLIELLIVIGILGILAVTVLLTLNPAEAQRKARDLQRAKDAITLQTIVEQAINDGVRLTACDGANPCYSGAVTQSCAAGNWLGPNLCNYAKTIPGDPLNGKTAACYSASNANNITKNASCNMRYAVRINGVGSSDYEIDYKVESYSNAGKLYTDGGDNTFAVEIFSNLGSLVPGTNY